MSMKDEPDAKRQKLEVKSSIEDLPDELVVEILCRLRHCKFVFQCNCISMHWLSLITSPYFLGRFIANNKTKWQPWAFVYFKFMMKDFHRPKNFDYIADWEEASKLKLISQYHSEFKSNEFSLEFLPNYYQGDRPITILKTFNDLILCCGEKFDKSEGVYYICNPQTKLWVALPPTPSNSKRCVDIEFFCEPYYYADKDHQGRVILNSQFKFKVLRFLNSFSSEGITLQIFSSETGQWNRTRITLWPGSSKCGVSRSFFCKEKLTLMLFNRVSYNTLSVITVDDRFNQSLQRVKFPGIRFCRIPYHSMLHLSSRPGRLRVVQISIIDVADHPDYGVPVMFIWWLRESLAEFRLIHRASFRNIASQNEWIKDFYLKRTFMRTEKGEYVYHTPIVLGFHPYNDNLLYLNLNCDNRLGFYDMKNRSLNLVSKTWCHASFPEYGFYEEAMWSDASKLVLPLWPTPIPQISQVAAQPCQD